MTKEEEVLSKYKEELLYKYSRVNTKSQRKRILYDLCVLSELLSMYPNINDELPWEHDERMISLLEEDNFDFINYVTNNIEIFNKCFCNVIDIFNTTKFPFYKYFQKTYKTISNNITNEIIFEFLNGFDQGLLKKYKKMLEEGKIFNCGHKLDCGYIFSFPSLHDNVILPVNDVNNSIYTSSILVHELGHLYETDIYNVAGNSMGMDMINKFPYYEVSSRFLEYCYLNYLKDNNIYYDDTIMALHNYYVDLFMNAFDISIIYKMKNALPYETDCIEVNEPDALKYANGLLNKFNLHSLETEKGDVIEIRDSFIYGIGDIFSFYLYENYKEDPKMFKKELSNTLLSYPYTGDIKEFERIGITKDKLTNKKELKRILDIR